MSILRLPHARPRVILFDWHATLVDTLDAMYLAVDDVIPKLGELGLLDRLVPTEDCKTVEDARLIKYVRDKGRLHPKIMAARKISRTDIFQVLFGEDQAAKRLAHAEFDRCYRHHFGRVEALEPDIPNRLLELRGLGLKLGVLSNRRREFMEHELAAVDGSGWAHLFDTMVCGDDVPHRKPAPDQILGALDNLGQPADTACWYVGDSTTDVIAAKEAGVTALFYNGAGWDQAWIDKIFPGTTRHPHKPDAVVGNFKALLELVWYFWTRPRHGGGE